MQIRLASDLDYACWNTFVIENSSSAFYSLYNTFEWRKVLQEAYGYYPYYFIAEENNQIVGCFPLMFVKSAFLGNRLVSLPFTDHGCGPVIANHADEALSLLLSEAEKLATCLKAGSIQINSPEDKIKDAALNYGFRKQYNYFTFLLDLSRPVDAIWVNFKKNIRNGVKKAEKYSLKLVVDQTPDSLQRIYRIHLNNMKRLGTPPHSSKFFSCLWNNMNKSNQVRTYLATYNGQDIAGIVLFPHRESVRWGTGAMRSEYRLLSPLYFLLWNAIQWSKENGYACFDMGGSRPDSGNYEFKEDWVGKNQANGKIVGLNHLHYFLNKDKTDLVSLENPNYMQLANLWRKYVPLALANSIGPYLRKQVAM